MKQRVLPILLIALIFFFLIVSLDVSPSFALDVSRHVVGAERVHRNSITGEGVTVAVIDTGIDFNHSDLQGAIKTSWNISDNNATLAQDTDGHGTRVAGIVAGRGVGENVIYRGVARSRAR